MASAGHRKNSMKAIRLTDIGCLEIVELPAPRIHGERDVLLRVEAVGICGSDIHFFRTGNAGGRQIKFPFRIGHECVGAVIETGDSVLKVRAGDRVAVDPAVSCGECDQCKKGRRNTCRRLLFMGIPGEMDGCLAEYLLIPEASCHPLEAGMSIEQGVLVEPFSVSRYALECIRQNGAKTIGILGAGPIGLGVLFCARSTGIQRIYVMDKLNYRLDRATELGADWVGNPDRMDVVSRLLAIEPNSLDVVFECCGSQEAISQGIDLLMPGGALVIIGIPETDHVTLDPHLLRRKEISIYNIRRQNDCTDLTIQMVAEKPEIESLVTHSFSVDEAYRAFDTVAGYKDGVIKAVIKF